MRRVRSVWYAQGFTLVELMIVLVIIAVLAGLAIPGYFSSVEKSRKQEALTSLTAVRGAEMRFFMAKNTYASSFTQLDFNPASAGPPGSTPHFTYALASPGATFTATATRNAVDFAGALLTGCPAGYTVTIIETGVIGGTC